MLAMNKVKDSQKLDLTAVIMLLLSTVDKLWPKWSAVTTYLIFSPFTKTYL